MSWSDWRQTGEVSRELTKGSYNFIDNLSVFLKIQSLRGALMSTGAQFLVTYVPAGILGAKAGNHRGPFIQLALPTTTAFTKMLDVSIASQIHTAK